MIGDSCTNERILKAEYGCFKFIQESIYQRIHYNSAFLVLFLTIEVFKPFKSRIKN